jgi:hypothetical protein
LSLSSSARANVVLPAPDGEESTSSSPRRAMRGAMCGVLWVSLLKVLHLLAHLIDDDLQSQTGARDVGIVGL